MKEQTVLLALGVLGIGACLAVFSRTDEDASEQPVATRDLAVWEREGSSAARPTETQPELIPAAPGGAAAFTRSHDLVEDTVDIHIYGSVVARVSCIEPLREAFSDAQSGIDALVHTSSDRNAIEHVITGKADVAIVTVNLSNNELEKGASAIQLGDFIPAIAVHHDNPLVSLTQDQVRSLFNGTTDNWSTFNSNLGSIDVMQPASKGMQNFYTELMLPGDSFIAGDRYQNEEDLYDALAADTGRIGITNLANLDTSRCRAIAIGSTLPNSYDFRMGMYPFGRTLSLVYRGMPSPRLQAFIDFVRSQEGRSALAQHLHLR